MMMDAAAAAAEAANTNTMSNLMPVENASTIIDSPIHLLMSHHKNQRALKHKRAQMELRERLLRQQQQLSSAAAPNYLNLDEQSELQMLQQQISETPMTNVAIEDTLLQQQKRASLGSNRNKAAMTSDEAVKDSSGLLGRSETITTNLSPAANHSNTPLLIANSAATSSEDLNGKFLSVENARPVNKKLETLDGI